MQSFGGRFTCASHVELFAVADFAFEVFGIVFILSLKNAMLMIEFIYGFWFLISESDNKDFSTLDLIDERYAIKCMYAYVRTVRRMFICTNKRD